MDPVNPTILQHQWTPGDDGQKPFSKTYNIWRPAPEGRAAHANLSSTATDVTNSDNTDGRG